MSKHYGKFPNFTDDELKCPCCGEFNDSEDFIEFMGYIQGFRNLLGFPLPVTSAYRCKNHPIEAKKNRAGTHSLFAIDIQVGYHRAMQLLKAAMNHPEINGIGLKQHGPAEGRYIHLDKRRAPALWTYDD